MCARLVYLRGSDKGSLKSTKTKAGSAGRRQSHGMLLSFCFFLIEELYAVQIVRSTNLRTTHTYDMD